MEAVASDGAKEGWDFICDFNVDCGSKEQASIVYSSLAVDKELQPDKVRRQVSISDGRLIVHFEAVEARFLRASFSSFVDLMILSMQFIEEFEPQLQQSRNPDAIIQSEVSSTA